MNSIPQSHPNASLYCELMEYVKWRIDEVLKTLNLVKSGKHYLSTRTAAEFCLLQLRMVFELIAIGCVAVHIDVPQIKNILENWNANDIMKRLEKLKPQYFPRAITEKQNPLSKIYEHHNEADTIDQKEFLR